MNATDLNIATFGSLNTRMSTLVITKIQEVFGKPAERPLMRTLTDHGIKAAERILELIEEGITYEKWKAYLNEVNVIDGPLAMFENSAGDMQKLLADYCATDLELAFDYLKESGMFNPENVRRDIKALRERLEFAEQMWASADRLDEQTEKLQGIDTSNVSV